jgi:hypothetical protein
MLPFLPRLSSFSLREENSLYREAIPELTGPNKDIALDSLAKQQKLSQ